MLKRSKTWGLFQFVMAIACDALMEPLWRLPRCSGGRGAGSCPAERFALCQALDPRARLLSSLGPGFAAGQARSQMIQHGVVTVAASRIVTLV